MNFRHLLCCDTIVTKIKVRLKLCAQNFQIVAVSRPCTRFFSLEFEIQGNFHPETTKIKYHSVRALERYMNEKNLIRGKETATI